MPQTHTTTHTPEEKNGAKIVKDQLSFCKCICFSFSPPPHAPFSLPISFHLYLYSFFSCCFFCVYVSCCVLFLLQSRYFDYDDDEDYDDSDDEDDDDDDENVDDDFISVF